MEPLGLGARALAEAIDASPEQVESVIANEKPMDAELDLRLARYFGNSPEFWLNLQAAHDLRAAEREAATRIEREVSPRAVA